MMFTSLSHQSKAVSRCCRRRPPRARLLLECLESRNLLSGIVNINTDTEGTVHAETTLAVNPTNPLNLIGSANDSQIPMTTGGASVFFFTQFSRAHVTFDGGHTWTTYPIDFHGYNFTGDPAVAFDADGTAYLATLGYVVPQTFATGITTTPDVVVAHSTDGGKSWSGPVRVASGTGTVVSAGTYNDKEYVAAWGHGNAIVTWAQFHLGPHGSIINTPIVASVTHDGGNTWTDPVPISGPFVLDANSVPTVAADGSIYVAFLSADEDAAPYFRDHYKVVRVDPNSGQALGAPVDVGLVYGSIVVSDFGFPNGNLDYPINVLGRTTYQDSQFRATSFGNMTADPTNANHLAVVWSDMRNNPYPKAVLPSLDPYQVKTNSDIIVSQSFDGGVTWSAPAAIQQPNDQFQPWGAYDATGHLQIGYYDRSYDPANHKYGYTLASETAPGSLTFTFQQLTTQLSDPTQGDAFFSGPLFGGTANSNFPNATTFMGDYSAIAVSPTGVDALWTDMRVPSTFPGFPGSGEDAFFADPPTAGRTVAAPAPTASPVLPSSSAAAVDALFVSLPGALDASENGNVNAPANSNSNAPANADAPEAAIGQWLMNQPTFASSAPGTDGPSTPGASATDSQPDGSLWSDPFAPMVLGL